MLLKKVFAWTASVIIFCLAPTATLGASTHFESLGFETRLASEKLEEFNRELGSLRYQDNELYTIVQELKLLEHEANACVEQGQKKIKTIKQHLQDINLGFEETSVNSQYFEDRKSVYLEKTAECRVFLFRVQETLSAYKDVLNEVSLSKKLRKNTPVWQLLGKKKLFSITLNPERFYQSTGLSLLTVENWIFLAVTLVVSVLLAWYARLLSLRFLKLENPLLVILRRHVPGIIVMSALSLCLASFFIRVVPTPSLVSVAFAGWYFLVAVFCAKLLLYLSKKEALVVVRDKLFRQFYGFSIVAFLGYSIMVFFKTQSGAAQLVELLRLFYVVFWLATFFWFSWKGMEYYFLTYPENKHWKSLSQWGMSVIFAILFITECVGYHSLTLFLINGMFSTAVVFAVLIGVISITHRGFSAKARKNENPLMQMLRKLSGVKGQENFYELVILKIAFFLVFLGIAGVSLLNVWGVPLQYIDSATQFFLKGFSVFEATIFPLRIVIGLISFSGVLIIGRIAAATVKRSERFKGEQSTQITLTSIINYLAFFVALFGGLLIAGVDFTGLAIIVGALSVGIGFGLQNIVNNFICGIVLLLQKPIRPGDRIVVGETEGFVRKIRVLSTQINTLAKEDVIVPNANLVYQPVTNYMFRDKLFRLGCKVGVAYGTDTDLVRQVLFDVGMSHPMVIKEEPNTPVVFFRSFGESNLDFELRCVISDVNERYFVMSDLHFEIDKAFKQHGIQMAFPQRDVHIRDYVKKEG